MELELIQRLLLVLTTYLGENPTDWLLNSMEYILIVSGAASILILLLTQGAKLSSSRQDQANVSKIIRILQVVINVLQPISLQPKSNELKDKIGKPVPSKDQAET